MDKARTRARGQGQRQQGQGRAGEGKGKIKEWLTFDDMEDDDDTMMRGGLKKYFFNLELDVGIKMSSSYFIKGSLVTISIKFRHNDTSLTRFI